jgi:hypothetical protein
MSQLHASVEQLRQAFEAQTEEIRKLRTVIQGQRQGDGQSNN